MREVVVFAALAMEISPLKLLLSGCERVRAEIPIYVGRVEGKKVILVRSGVGKRRALAAAELVETRFSAQSVLSTGFCGGLVPEIRPSDVVVGSWVVSQDTASSAGLQRLSLEGVCRARELLGQRGVCTHVGGFVSVSRPVLRSTERRRLARETGAIGVEMETYSMATFFLPREISVMAMRAVLDGSEEGWPSMRSLVRRERLAGAPGGLRRLFAPWGALMDLRRLRANGKKAQASLRKSLVALLRAWP